LFGQWVDEESITLKLDQGLIVKGLDDQVFIQYFL
jgi:hypothetical protein